jgi:hypothetical protein
MRHSRMVFTICIFLSKIRTTFSGSGWLLPNHLRGLSKAEPTPIPGSYSIDPAVFTDTDGQTYMYFGGIWGGQLQRWHSGKYDKSLSTDLGKDHDQEPALSAKVARMSGNMLTFAEAPRDVQILDENGKLLLAGDHDRRFFEGAWMHKFNGKYYFSYSTGDTHFLCYAESSSPYGPFAYKGVIMKPVEGWTTHHSIVEFKGKWYIFYHDTEISGKTHLRNVKVRELVREKDGAIRTIVNPEKRNNAGYFGKRVHLVAFKGCTGAFVPVISSKAFNQTSYANRKTRFFIDINTGRSGYIVFR